MEGRTEETGYGERREFVIVSVYMDRKDETGLKNVACTLIARQRKLYRCIQNKYQMS